MVETGVGQVQVLNLGLKSKIMPFKTLMNVRDIKKAKQQLKGLKGAVLKAKMSEAKGNMEGYVRAHDDGLQHAEEAAKHLYDSIKLDIIDLQIIKSIIRQTYGDDARLRQKGFPEGVGRGLRNGTAHTRQKINGMLRETSDMLGALTKR